MVRTRIVYGADGRAARALRHGIMGLTVGVLLLLASGIDRMAGTGLRAANSPRWRSLLDRRETDPAPE